MPKSKAGPRKKRRWLSYLDLIIVFVIFNIVLILIFLLPRTPVSPAQATPSQMKQGRQTSLAIPAIPNSTQDVKPPPPSQDPQPSPQCTTGEHLDGSCLEGIFDDNGDTYKNSVKDPNNKSPVLNPLADNSALFFYTPYKDTVDNPQVHELWTGILMIVDVFIVLILMLNGIRVIFSGMVFRFDKAVEELPGIFLAIIAAHLSITFIMAILGLNNILVYDTYQWAGKYIFQQNGVPVSEGNTPYTVNIVIGRGHDNTPEYDNLPDDIKKNNCHFYLDKGEVLAAIGTATGNPLLAAVGFFDELFMKNHHWFGAYYCKNVPTDMLVRTILLQSDLNFTSLFDNLQDLGNGLKIILKIMALMLMAQMVIRLFFIIFYIVTAPLGLACWALPGKVGQSVTNQWLKGFISTVMVQFVMVVALIVMQLMAAAVLHFISPTNGTTNTTIGPGQLDTFTLLKLMCLCFFWFLIRIPSLLGTAPMRSMVLAGQGMAQAVGATIAIQVAEAQFVIQSASSVVSMAASAR
ncbi:hypothetical protein [Ktedonobacter robiniae]|uniref:hypothetical protein n=1 Tax=Ktedonobacter robiniae TaxID=2778365 RepID=UPI001916A9F8|nr:hypothetical protein [Ktedonobacter robiniae]